MSAANSSAATAAALPTSSSTGTLNDDGQPPPTPIETSLDFWQKFGLNARRAALDSQGLAIADRQEASAASRKQLSASTRAFRKSIADGAQLSSKDVGAILRGYQTEIDSLTNRSKSAETSFIALYKALYDAPDPADVLSQAVRDVHAVFQLREQVSTLKEERGELVERTTVTATLEKRVYDLELQLSNSDQRAAEDAHAFLEEKQTQWMAAQQKTIEAYELREQELIHQLRLANDSNRRMQASTDEMQQQLNDSRSQLEHLKSTRVSVNDMAVEDLERTRAEANSLRRRCQQLENRLAGRLEDADVDLSDDIASGIGSSALSAEIAARDVQVSQLKDQVSALEEVLGGKDLEKRNEFAKLTTLISDKDTELTTMRGTLNKLPTVEAYQDMKRQFDTLQSFQLLDAESSELMDKTGSGDGAKGQEATPRSVETLEKRLLTKVKSLEGRLTKMRVDLSDKDGKINQLETSVRSYEDQMTDQKMLISKLEDGINAMTGDSASVQTLKRRAAAASKVETDESGPAGVESKNGEESGPWDWGEKHQAEGLENIIQQEPSMLDIVAGQRDRFRSRTMELEDDNRKVMERVEKVTNEVDSLKNDNVRLYEKLRFVQSYRQSNGALAQSSGVNAMAVDIGTPDGDEEDGTGLLGKYRSMYEDMVNPYTIFNRRERHKRMSEMSAPERLTMRAGQRALSTKTSRLIVFFYIVALHVLVALVLSFSNSICDSESVTTKARH